jgi:protein-tyrosine-phosphatase
MTATKTVLFLCPHNAAKSVLAAAYFDRLAQERGLDVRADSAGTEPDDEAAPAVVAALRNEGLDVAGHRPRLIADGDLTAAWRVVSLGCALDERLPSGVRVESWDDVPSPGQDLAAARAAIRRHLDGLLDDLEGDA